MSRPETPFPFLLVDDFLPSDILASLERKMMASSIPQKHPAGYMFRGVFDETLIRFLYRFIRKEVRERFKVQYGFSPVYKLPQLYRVDGPWKGLPPHLDNQPGRDLAMIIYLSRGWKPDYGGELRLLDAEMNPFATVAPICNRAVFFPLWGKVLA